uniref:Uncharacterized protein n=1 Tax=Parascaris equorum TaxID=6256 RepID=A0A914S4S7_PAREQ
MPFFPLENSPLKKMLVREKSLLSNSWQNVKKFSAQNHLPITIFSR